MDASFWEQVVQHDYAVPEEHSLPEMTTELLSLLGSPDPALRDRYAYPILEHWLHADAYDADAIRRTLAELAANLTRGLGERESNSVFLRAFSVLMLAEIVHYDNAHQTLDPEEVVQLLELGLVYLDAERDLRGWVHEKGWAHSVAHTADLLFVLAQSRHLASNDLSRILQGVTSKLAAGGAFFVCGEDDRLTRAVVAVIERGLLGPQAIRDWLAGVVTAATVSDWLDATEVERLLDVAHNTKQMLRSLFAALALRQGYLPMAAELLQPVLLAGQSLGS